MRRTFLAALLLVTLAASAVIIIVVGLRFLPKPAALAADPGKPEGAAKLAAPQLPVSRVILFSSGVGYFQREGQVDGNARVDLSFPVRNVNDLLKSMVLQDMNGGRISTVNYESHDPIDKTLRSFAVNLTGNPSFGQLLNQARGEKAEVTLQQSNATQAGTVTGTIVGVEQQKQIINKDTIIEVEFLNVWTEKGLRSFRLADVQQVRFVNPVMEAEFSHALEVLAKSHDTQKKAVSITFTGDGKRQVRVCYVIENPIWKTSYRLVLDKKEKPFLQGWAVVENPSDEDWKDVRMSLVSGRPISFQMDLYQPLYVPRPVVEPELFASLRPPTYSGALDVTKGVSVGRRLADDWAEKDKAAADKPAAKSPRSPMLDSSPASNIGPGNIDPKRLASSAATASSLGDFFQYVIDQPVTLPRQKSAMLPIVSKEVEASRVSIYNESTLAKHPLLGLRFKNTTGLHLMQGPITIFDGSSYAGDARVLDLQPNEERLISYAIDLGTEVDPVAKRDPDKLIAVKIDKGILIATGKIRESKTYKVKNRSETDRTLLIEHPFRPDYKLVSTDKPAEQARDVYRFEVKVPVDKTAELTVTEELDAVQHIVLTDLPDQTVRIFLASNVTSEKVQAALKKALELKSKLEATRSERTRNQGEFESIRKDQERMRENLKVLPQTSDAYKRFVNDFDTQETEIKKLQGQIKKLDETVQQQENEYRNYLSNLSVE